jgi:hypothetical protein
MSLLPALAQAVFDGAESVPVDIGAELAALLSARFLIEPEVNAAVDARIIDVVGDLFEV